MMMKSPKICFIYVKEKFNGFLPLGISYLAAYLRQHSYLVSSIDSSIYKNERELYAEIESTESDIFALSVMTPYFDFADRISNYIRKKHPESIIIWGGPHSTVLTSQTLNETAADYVITGEGEKVFLKFLDSGISNNIPGLFYIDKNKNLIGEKHTEFIEDLDDLPYPARDLLQTDVYVKTGKLHLTFSRGCPFTCTYCQPTLENTFGKKVRYRSPENVIDEIIFLKNKYNVRNFSFVDDTLTLNKKHFIRFCNLVKEKDLKITWKFNTRVDTINEEMIKLAADSGANEIAVGVEAGNDFIREQIYKKNISKKQIIDVFSWLHKYNIEKSSAYVMIGAPEESIEMIGETLELMKRIKPSMYQLSKTTPLPGTYLYDLFKEKDLLENEYSFVKTIYAKTDHSWRTDTLSENEKNQLFKVLNLELSQNLKIALNNYLKNYKNNYYNKIFVYLLLRKFISFSILNRLLIKYDVTI